ncbi:Aste57867_22032 [Aphanomyces stellatus]|uniref:Aste57867_22032 protein n=1 Tax=Aphanomyces stellatus TaxID=120398 RepID=A0A485LKH1_9STRA|nr:hypothetical protein As57867_021963 [Aphanomyces stellatus]VFT98700.1 Aste57867_22032 [Aphanomyces stellatus]
MQLTGRLNPCGQVVNTLLAPSKDNVLLSAMATSLDVADINLICAHDSPPSICLGGFLAPSVAYLQTFIVPTTAATLNAMARVAVANVRIGQPSLLQYVRENQTQPLQMLTLPLSDASDPTFDFWSMSRTWT